MSRRPRSSTTMGETIIGAISMLVGVVFGFTMGRIRNEAKED